VVLADGGRPLTKSGSGDGEAFAAGVAVVVVVVDATAATSAAENCVPAHSRLISAKLRRGSAARPEGASERLRRRKDKLRRIFRPRP